MNNRQLTIAVFEHGKVDRILWQPRLHHWYEVNRARGTLPKEYANKSILEIYDELGASPRGYHFFNDTIRVVEGEGVKVEVMEDSENVYTKYITPIGVLRQVERKNLYGTNRIRVEYFLKNVEDFAILEYILKKQSFEFDKELYVKMENLVGDRCEPIVNVRWGSIQKLFIMYMGFKAGIIALWKYREKIERLMDVFDENDDKLFNLLKKTPFKIVNFTDNIDEGLLSPALFQRYMLPYYRKRTKELHQVGKYCTSHWDGKVKHLIHFARETGLDGLECVPPEPQGNVSLEDLRQNMGEMVLVDGIPATHFLSITSTEELETFVRRLIGIFKPNLIAGISDMMPPDGDIERVKFVGEIIKKVKI
jgi:hypothetical protein